MPGRPVQQIVIGSCTNGRLDDIEVAARILAGKKVARGVRMLVFPASGRIFREAMKAGYLMTLMEAGAVIANSAAVPAWESTRARSAMARWPSPPPTATSRAAWATRMRKCICAPRPWQQPAP